MVIYWRNARCLRRCLVHRPQNNGQQEDRTAINWIVWAVPNTGREKVGLHKFSHCKSMDIKTHNELAPGGSLNGVFACLFYYCINTLYQHDDLTLSFPQSQSDQHQSSNLATLSGSKQTQRGIDIWYTCLGCVLKLTVCWAASGYCRRTIGSSR